jgi:DNA polymerase V
MSHIFNSTEAVGFPSPAEPYVESKLDLNDYLVHHRESTFFLRVQGNSMISAGIHDGDLIVVDRSLKTGHRKIVVAIINGELIVSRLLLQKGKAVLVSENPDHPAIHTTKEQSFQIWGVVTSVIHRF